MARTWIARILFAFVIFTLGFGIGKEVGLRKRAPGPGATGDEEALAASRADKVLVYYMHTTFRCVTCNTLERMAKEVVETGFADALTGGRIEWREVDFQEREDLAVKYDISSSCVVVVQIHDGKEVDFQRLDDVWTLADKPAAFRDYVAGAIRNYLDELPER